MLLSRVIVGALLVTAWAPSRLEAQERGVVAAERHTRTDPSVAPGGLQLFGDRPARAFQRLFGTPVHQSALPVPPTDDYCQGWYFTPCDPFTECAVDSYICEVSPRTGVAQPTWLMACSGCQPSPGE